VHSHSLELAGRLLAARLSDRQGRPGWVGRVPPCADGSLGGRVLARSSRTATARTCEPSPTITVISRTPLAGELTMTRRTRGWYAVASIGPSWLIRRRACSVVHGMIWSAGRDPASVSAST